MSIPWDCAAQGWELLSGWPLIISLSFVCLLACNTIECFTSRFKPAVFHHHLVFPSFASVLSAAPVAAHNSWATCDFRGAHGPPFPGWECHLTGSRAVLGREEVVNLRVCCWEELPSRHHCSRCHLVAMQVSEISHPTAEQRNLLPCHLPHVTQS